MTTELTAQVSEPGGEVLLYQSEDGSTRIEVRVEGETVWLSQKAMADLFQKDVRTISEHIRNIFEEGELQPDSVIRGFRKAATGCKRAARKRRQLMTVERREQTTQSTKLDKLIWANLED